MRIAVNLPRFPNALVHLDRLPVFLHAFPTGELLGRRRQSALRRPGIEDFVNGSIDRQRARADLYLLYVVAAASFVEITSDLHSGDLAAYFARQRVHASGSGSARSMKRNSMAVR
jgi:hypothetical protein